MPLRVGYREPVSNPVSRAERALPRVGGYRLLAQIGEGGMGVVHLAQATDGSRVALKVLRPHVVGDRESRERLAREVASLLRVTSARVAEVIDADPWGATPYVAARYVPGLSLHEHVRRHGAITGADLAHLSAGLLEAVVAVHRAGVLHRDIKPSNVLLEGRAPVLIDFGLARLAEDARLTRTGFLLGTPGYLAPEILYGDDATTASDVHSWAATVVFAATGRPPFGTGPALAVMDRVRRGEHDLSAVPTALLPLVRAALAADPRDRPTTTELMASLGRATPAQPSASPQHPERDDFTLPFAAVAAEQRDPAATDLLEAPQRTPVPDLVPAPPRTAPFRDGSRPDPARDMPTAALTRQLPAPDHRAARAPYVQPPPPRDRLGRSDPERTPVASLQRRLLMLGLLAATALGLALAPYVGLAVLAVVALGLRAVSWTTESAHRRQYRRGRRRWYDGPLTVLSSPWYLVVAAPGTLLLVAWAGFVACVVGVTYLLVGGPALPGLLVTGVVTVVCTWWGPASRRVRTPTRRLLVAATRVPAVGWCAVAAIVALAWLLGYALASGGVVWDPAAGSPWRPGTSLGSLLRWL